MTQKIDLDARQKAIKELISNEQISDQKLLVQRLKKQYSIETNQAVVSRDIRRMGVVKKERQGFMAYELPTTDTRVEILKLAIVDITHNEAMIVIKTYPGLADFVGDCLDQHTDIEMMGCLSGENTVFVTPMSVKEIHKTYQSVCQKMYFKDAKGK